MSIRDKAQGPYQWSSWLGSCPFHQWALVFWPKLGVTRSLSNAFLACSCHSSARSLIKGKWGRDPPKPCLPLTARLPLRQEPKLLKGLLVVALFQHPEERQKPPKASNRNVCIRKDNSLGMAHLHLSDSLFLWPLLARSHTGQPGKESSPLNLHRRDAPHKPDTKPSWREAKTGGEWSQRSPRCGFTKLSRSRGGQRLTQRVA